MFKNKWMKYVALAVVVLMAISMLASCKSGRTYDDLAGEAGAITVLEKDEVQDVPYDGETILVPFETDDPQYAPGNGSDDDDDNNGGGSSNSGDDDNNGGSSDGGEDDNNGGSSDDDDDDNNGGSSNGGVGDENVTDDSEKYAKDESGTPITMMLQNLNTATYSGNMSLYSLEARGIRFKALVEKHDPDIIAVCECSRDWGAELEYQFGDEYIVYYMFRSTTNLEGTGVLYKKDKYEELDRGHFWHSETPDQESRSFGDLSAPARICTWVKLKDKATGVQFYVYSTHFGLDGYQGGPKDVTLRAGQHMANVVDALPKGTFAFALGDLNTGYLSNHYLQFVDLKRLVDLRDLCYEMQDYGVGEMGEMGDGSFNGLDEKNADGGGSYIDHILAKPHEKMAVEHYSVLFEQPEVQSEGVGPYFISDHFGVLAKVRINTDVSYRDFYGDAY